MYSVVKDGAEIGLTEKPQYIRLQENGSYALCDIVDAQGISFADTVYHVWGMPEVRREGIESVALVEVNSGARLFSQEKAAKAALLTLADAEMIDNNLPGISDAISDARAGLVSPPVNGDPWSASARYITGDTCAADGVIYVAQRYSRGKAPSTSPHYWQPAPVEPVRQAWVDIVDGTVINVGVIVTHEGAAWKCTSQHIKSTVYRPKAGSSKWTIA